MFKDRKIALTSHDNEQYLRHFVSKLLQSSCQSLFYDVTEFNWFYTSNLQ